MKKSKFWKGLSVGVVAAMMAAAMIPTTAFAADQPLTSQTVTMPSDVTGASYSIYQVAAAAYDNSNGTGYYTYTLASGFTSVSGLAVDTNGRLTYNSAVLSTETAAGTLQTLANALQTAAASASTTATAESGGDVSLAPGYYLILTSGTQVTGAPILVSVTDEPVTLTDSKTSDLTFAKNITGITNGAFDETGKKTAEGAVGSVVSYEIVTNFPEYSADVTNVTDITDFIITDDPSSGLDIDTSTVKVEVNSSEVTASDDTYTLTTNVVGTNGGNGFTVKFDDGYVIDNENATVKVTFNATIKDTSVAQTAIQNDATLVYGNDYQTGGGNGSEKDDTDVFRTDLIIQKNDESSQPLSGVGFTVYKDAGSWTKGEQVGDERFTNGEGKITINDLPAGNYIIEETTVPDGYKKADNVNITITNEKSGTAYTANYTFVGTEGANNNTTTIVNIKGQTLPGTGGMGTYIFTGIGVGVILLAGVMLVVYMKKRKVQE